MSNLKNEILVKYLNARLLKQKAIRCQDFQKAAISRDCEKKAVVELFKDVNGVDPNWNTFKCDDFVYKLFLDNFGIDMSKMDVEKELIPTIKQILRNKKIDDLGI